MGTKSEKDQRAGQTVKEKEVKAGLIRAVLTFLFWILYSYMINTH